MCSVGLRKAAPVTDPLVGSLFQPSMHVSEPMTIFYWWILGVLGATMIGWAIALYVIIRNAFRHQERWAWSAIISIMSVWYLLDTSISLYYGIMLNAVFNTVLLLLFLFPPSGNQTKLF
jgi:predicted membrane protein